MHEEELLDFADLNEEPVLREYYVPSFKTGVHGKRMIVLVGKRSRNRFRGSHKFDLDKRSLAELYHKKMYAEWDSRRRANEAEAPKKKS